jgi:hypothetical protein
VAEVCDEAVGRAASEQASSDLVERLQRGGLEGEMVKPSSAEHRHLTVALGAVGELEDVELRGWPDPHEGEFEPVTLLQHLVGGAEDIRVELKESLGVTGQHGDVVEPAQQHDRSVPHGCRPRPPWDRNDAAAAIESVRLQ